MSFDPVLHELINFKSVLKKLEEESLNIRRADRLRHAWPIVCDVVSDELLAELVERGSRHMDQPEMIELVIELLTPERASPFLFDLDYLRLARRRMIEGGERREFFVDLLKRATALYGISFELDCIEDSISRFKRSAQFRIRRKLNECIAETTSALKFLKDVVSKEVLEGEFIGNAILGSLQLNENDECMPQALRMVRENFRFDSARFASKLRDIAYETPETAAEVRLMLPLTCAEAQIRAGITSDDKSLLKKALSEAPASTLSHINGLDGISFHAAMTNELLQVVLGQDWITADGNFPSAGEPEVVRGLQLFIERLCSDSVLLARLRQLKGVGVSPCATVPYFMARGMLQEQGVELPMVEQVSLDTTAEDAVAAILLADRETQYLGSQHHSMVDYLTTCMRHLARSLFEKLDVDRRPEFGLSAGDPGYFQKGLETAIQLKIERATFALNNHDGSYSYSRLPIHNQTDETFLDDIEDVIVDALVSYSPSDLIERISTANPFSVASAIHAKLIDPSHMDKTTEALQTKLMASTFDL
ncbi:hypothetical protein HNP46_000488 [Pseudomonas nitritireducens]|uniref:Uncharacterized protein n=1 Tax=Pseudomonas nitroreducens TaxID=46680 RepID=A0A7W7KF30_PSENT|nr:hypothetical protein [Pseudomonas nitritireducens]MBB4861677.1 hypothetical protein [Pseudomonas nitritireducens]